MISTLFDFLVSKTIGLSLLISIILLIRPFILRYLNASAAYSLWIMLPIFLLLPQSLFSAHFSEVLITFFPNSNNVANEIPLESFIDSSLFKTGILALWGSGFFLSLLGIALRYKRLNQSCQTFNYRLPANSIEEKLTNKIAETQILQTPLVDVPAIYGFINAKLILPKGFETLNLKHQLIILQHEFYHINRHDHRFNLLRLFLKAAFWFNPLVFYADKIIEADQEISCDLGVLNQSTRKDKRAYADALVEFASGGQSNSLVSQWKYQSLIKERIKMLKYTNKKKWHSFVAAAIGISSISLTSSVVAFDTTPTEFEAAKPIVVIQPMYPRKAVDKKIEGEVKFKFSIDESGNVVEPEIIQSEPEGIFDADAMKAIKKWKFKPRVVGGNAEAQHNMVYTMQFKLSNDETSDSLPMPTK